METSEIFGGIVVEDGPLSTVDAGEEEVVVEAGSPGTAAAFEDVAVEDEPLPVISALSTFFASSVFFFARAVSIICFRWSSATR